MSVKRAKRPEAVKKGLKIKLKRISKGLKQYELARMAGLREGRLAWIENGYDEPTADELKQINEVFREAAAA